MIEFIVKNAFTYFHRVSKIVLGLWRKIKKRCTCRSIITKYVILKHRKRDVTRFNMLTWFSKWIFDRNVLKSRGVDRVNALDRRGISSVFIPRATFLYPVENPLKQSTREKSASTFPNGSWKRSDRVVVQMDRKKKKWIGKRTGNLYNETSFSDVEWRLFNIVLSFHCCLRAERETGDAKSGFKRLKCTIKNNPIIRG